MLKTEELTTLFLLIHCYKGYYHSLYDKYFHSKVIDKALKSSEYTSSDWDSYIFRIINLTNKNSDLDALPDLRKSENLSSVMLRV